VANMRANSIIVLGYGSRSWLDMLPIYRASVVESTR